MFDFLSDVAVGRLKSASEKEGMCEGVWSKAMDRIQGYIDTPDTIRSIREAAAGCTVLMQSGSSVVVDGEYRAVIAILAAASCSAVRGSALGSEHLTSHLGPKFDAL
jgi:hypothetical protein